MSTRFLIIFNGYINLYTSIATALNVAWIFELVINAIVQSDKLDEWVQTSKKYPIVGWRWPLAVSAIFAVLSIIFMYLAFIPWVQVKLGIFTDVCGAVLLAGQSFIMIDYYVTLRHYISGWFRISTLISSIISVISLILTILYIASEISISNYGG